MQGNQDWRLFAINLKTGVIVSAVVLEHQMKSEYTLRVLATDGGTPPRQSAAIVQINVLQNTDSQSNTGKSMSLEVVENIAPGAIVGSIPAPTGDTLNDGPFYFYILNGDVFGTFAINVTNGDLFVSGTVDYEMCTSYVLRIMIVNSNLLSPSSTMATANIAIIDVNDNPPTFATSPMVFIVREKVPLGSQVFAATAQDADSGLNGQITYSISSQSPVGSWFSIDANSGMLTVVSAIDWQVVKMIEMLVIASDNAPIMSNRLSTSQTILALVEDINDNAPVFLNNVSVVSLREDDFVGHIVMRVIASDPDYGSNGQVTYAIESGAEDGRLVIDSSTGECSFLKN